MALRLAVLLLSVVQVLATLLPSIGIGTPIGDQSDNSHTLITPVGWTFSIWGPLFAGSITYGVYQALPAQRGSALLRRIALPAGGAFLGNAVWALYTQSFALGWPSVVIILFTLACLLTVFRILADWPERLTSAQRFLVALPLSALAGWLTAASIVNIAGTLTFYGFRPPIDPVLLGTAIVGVGGLIAAGAVASGRGNPWYTLVFLWALLGIRAAALGDGNPQIAWAAVGAGLLVAVVALASLAKRENRRHWFG